MFEWIRHWRYGNQYGFEKYFRQQDTKPVGRPGIILAELGMPEDFDPEFYTRFMDHVFVYSLPGFLQPIILADRGIALIDPSNPLAREEFKPASLVDMHGSSENAEGRPYIECEVTWRPPGMKRNPYDHGYFLYKGAGKGGAPDVCQKTAAKVAGWYYGHLLPKKKVAWEYQCRKLFEESAAALKARHPDASVRHARYMYEESMQSAIEELLAEGCETIIYHCFCNPVYSDFEDYSLAVPLVHRLAKGRAKVICADQPGNQPAMREAFAKLAIDHLTRIPPEARLLLILSKHGHPFRKETQDNRGHEYRLPLERAMRDLMNRRSGKWELVWSDDEYADEYWDPRRKKFSTYDAYRKAIEEGYDYALELPTDFIAENTDLMFFHAIKKFRAFAEFDPYTPVPYPDWDKPLTRVFREGKTTGIYAGCPVGPYRSLVAEAVSASVSEILENHK
ncbi:hypothetical protein EG827_01025 [bacterium]|nr:hypothetical protein [bacterium]